LSDSVLPVHFACSDVKGYNSFALDPFAYSYLACHELSTKVEISERMLPLVPSQAALGRAK
jgi:hypothetical protein